jgi:hypothetical protein
MNLNTNYGDKNKMDNIVLSSGIEFTPKIYTLFSCPQCCLETNNKPDYKKHLLTAKHKNRSFCSKKLLYNFVCEKCRLTTNNKYDYEKHILTAKHLKVVNVASGRSSTVCFCGKHYKHAASLYKHQKSCTAKAAKAASSDVNQLVQVVKDVVKSNTELQEKYMAVVTTNTELHQQNSLLQQSLIDVCKQIQPINVGNITSNSHNKTFNLQVFLNEECKDAMNLQDFVDSVQLQLSDLEEVGELGYAEGMSKLIITKLNALDIRKRPIHCSDRKRDIMHIKDQDKWQRDTPDQSKLRSAIKRISKKNSDLLMEWKAAHPNVQLPTHYKNDQYLHLIIESIGGSGDIEVSERKIIKNIAKHVFIQKSEYVG